MKRIVWWGLLAGVLTLPAQDIKEFEKKVTEFTLPNGLQFLVVERHEAPAVSFATYVRAGTANDVTGRTGLARLFERILMTGTETIGSKNWLEEHKAMDAAEDVYDQLEAERNLGPKASQSRVDTLQMQLRIAIDTAGRYGQSGAYANLIEENGSTRLAANVSADAAEYSYSLPSNRIELWFLMESQRLMRPVFRDFYKERDAAVEKKEKRLKTSTQARLFTAFTASAFQAHPYRNPAGGWPGELANVRRSEARAFFDRYYVPGNVVMAIVGDVNPGEARRMAEKYFGAWPAKPLPPFVRAQEPPQPGPRSVVVEAGTAPIALVGYKRPNQFDRDDAAFDVLQLILSHGKTGLLYRELVTDKHLAQRVDATATFPGGLYPNLFLLAMVAAQGHTIEENQKALDDFLLRLKQQRLDQATIARAKAQARLLLINRLASNAGMASILTTYHGSYGSWRKLFTAADDLNKVTAEDIQRVLIRYFVPAGRTTAYTVLPGQSGVPPVQRAGAPGGQQ